MSYPGEMEDARLHQTYGSEAEARQARQNWREQEAHNEMIRRNQQKQGNYNEKVRQATEAFNASRATRGMNPTALPLAAPMPPLVAPPMLSQTRQRIDATLDIQGDGVNVIDLGEMINYGAKRLLKLEVTQNDTIEVNILLPDGQTIGNLRITPKFLTEVIMERIRSSAAAAEKAVRVDEEVGRVTAVECGDDDLFAAKNPTSDTLYDLKDMPKSMPRVTPVAQPQPPPGPTTIRSSSGVRGTISSEPTSTFNEILRRVETGED